MVKCELCGGRSNVMSCEVYYKTHHLTTDMLCEKCRTERRIKGLRIQSEEIENETIQILRGIAWGRCEYCDKYKGETKDLCKDFEPECYQASTKSLKEYEKRIRRSIMEELTEVIGT